MDESLSKVYISMPTRFLEDLDRLAKAERLSRSALIRQAVTLYMERRDAAERFFRASDRLAAGFSELDEAQVGGLVDDAVAAVRSRRRHV